MCVCVVETSRVDRKCSLLSLTNRAPCSASPHVHQFVCLLNVVEYNPASFVKGEGGGQRKRDESGTSGSDRGMWEVEDRERRG